MVNTNTLAALAEELGLGEHLYLGKGIAKGGGRGLKSLLANAFEAVLGAVFLDAGYDAAYHYYLDRFRKLPEPVKDENHKGRLQQVVQERFNQTPFYDSAGARTGQRREDTAVVFAGAEALGTGHGHTKQEAEQDAARDALSKLVGGSGGGAVTAAARAPRAGRPRRRRTSSAPAVPAERGAEGDALALPAERGEEVDTLALPAERDALALPAERGGEDALALPAERGGVGEGPSEPPAEPAPDAEAAEAPKPRRRRSSTRRRTPAPGEPVPAEAGPAEAASSDPAPEPPPPAPEPPRSRQFGAPIDG